MNSNIKFISSISTEGEFETLVKKYAEELFKGNAYLVGGPYDNGKDLVIKRNEREIRQAAQITIQEKRIEEKLEADLLKAVKLVDEHNYPPILHFFWSHPISEYTLDKLRTASMTKHLISLEFYDAKRIAQDLTDHYPHILNYLIKEIHKIDIQNDEPINFQQRAFYEYLLLSKDSTNLKNAIIDANILSHLNEGGKTIEELLGLLQGVNLRIGSLKGKLQTLTRAGKTINQDGVFTLSREEISKLENIKLRDSTRKQELIKTISVKLAKHTDKDFASEVVKLIITAYEESISIQITESKFEPPKLKIFQATINNLKILINEKCDLDRSESEALASELLELAGENEYLSEHCSAKLCVNFLSDSKLEKYIEDKSFYIYLDAPVLIPYLITIMFKDATLFDKSIRNINLLRENINLIKNKRLRVSTEHFEETARHFSQAEKLSQFVTEELVDQLGESKNVYFNVYMKWKKKRDNKTNFEDFTSALLGLEKEDINPSDKFTAYASCIFELLTAANFDVIDNKDLVPSEFVERTRRKFIRTSTSFRPYRAIDNDIYCAYSLGEERLHLNSKGYFSTPMLITLDTSQYLLRDIIRREKKYAEWLIYTPQRAIERLSLVGLKISSESLKDGVLATISEEYFFKENSISLLDTLSVIIDDNHNSEGDVIKFVTSLRRKVNEEALDYSEIDVGHYNNISYVLLFIHREFKDQFSKIIKLFADANHQDILTKLLMANIKGEFDEKKRDLLREDIQKVLMSYQ
ncbi:hypothetical protein [Erwinia persicina]|uniref:hypothetical protein n=1 Tax=Erwinia persicina TaxID=55211 RepID=UPI001783D3F1|nr:hypothetical protein [Erwinia persicina]MBD8164206.1 hypothetical protein [Erwinia persicina]